MATNQLEVLRLEITAVAGEEALNPPIENPTERLWDAEIGGVEADIFDGFTFRNRRLTTPEKLLASHGVDTLRDAALIGGRTLLRLEHFGPAAVMNMWRGMRSLEPSLPLLLEPNMEAIVSLSLGNLGRVPVAAATGKWLPNNNATRYFKDGRSMVSQALDYVEQDSVGVFIRDEKAQRWFKRDLVEFKNEYERVLAQQRPSA